MQIWQDFHFIRPLWLLAIPVFFFLLYKLWQQVRIQQNWRKVCDAELLPYMLIKKELKKIRSPRFLLGLTGLIAFIALAGPTWERAEQPVFKNDNALVILLDLSLSMLANDITPSRLQRSHYKIIDLLKQRHEGQSALMVYSGDAFTVTPLTDDVETIISQIAALEPAIMPIKGSNVTGSLQKASDLFKQSNIRNGHILLITDEVDDSDIGVFGFLHQRGFTISVLGVGTKQGAPIPLGNGRFLQAQGKVVISKFNEKNLQQAAKSGGGVYVRLANNNSDIEALLNFFHADKAIDKAADDQLRVDVWHEKGVWLTLLLIPLSLLAFRRGLLVLVLVPLLFSHDGYALDWQGLWLNESQRAEQHQQTDLLEQGIKHYKNGDYQAAEQAFAKVDNEIGLYNLGNTLAKQKKYHHAINLYNEVLKRNAENADALHNKALVEKELTKQAEENQQQDGEGQKQQQDNQNQQGDQGQQQDNNGQQDDQSAQNDQEQPPQDGQGQQDSQNEQPDQQNDKPADKKTDGDNETPEITANESPLDENEQATEQWLRRIPDDPGGLLRRKFYYQYSQEQPAEKNDKFW